MAVELRVDSTQYGASQLDQSKRIGHKQSWSSLSGGNYFPDRSGRRTSLLPLDCSIEENEEVLISSREYGEPTRKLESSRRGSMSSIFTRKTSTLASPRAQTLKNTDSDFGIMKIQQLMDCIAHIDSPGSEGPPPRPPKGQKYTGCKPIASKFRSENKFTNSHHTSGISSGASASAMLRKSRTSTDLHVASKQKGSASITSFTNIRDHLRKYSESEMKRGGSHTNLNHSSSRTSSSSFIPSTSSPESGDCTSLKTMELYTKLQRVTRMPRKKVKPQQLKRESKSSNLLDVYKHVTHKSRSYPASPQTPRKTSEFHATPRPPGSQRRPSLSMENLLSSTRSNSRSSSERPQAVTSSSHRDSESETAVFDGEVHYLEDLNISALLRAHTDVFSGIDWGESLGNNGELHVAILGARGTGKTALSNRLCKGMFDASYEPTIAETHSHTVFVGGHKCSIRILDSSMDEWTCEKIIFRANATSPGMYRASNRSSSTLLTLGTKSSSLKNLSTVTNRKSNSVPSSIDPLWWAHGYILTFSADDRRSFEHVVSLKEELMDRRRRFPALMAAQFPIIVVGTKADVYGKDGKGKGVADNLPAWLTDIETLVTMKWGFQFKLVTCTGHHSNKVFHDLAETMRDYYIQLLLREGFSYSPNYALKEGKEQSVSSAPGRMVTS
ncbi:hypothetical protein SARC_06287 [Sphaeroforma arctica JP610]|uniref:Uncharacterized protein n=1 Tax=Sphaeroforma arctica JP610 TaxID=667725 RepID=A0A0L0FX23_9EUKA|nr:hypothetical protein SARC_06287 [Sphaeroforma arctica JP610]KNC81382.1 hypothetical protein SARC_06287 [Sphaeroforma arctica JP610]|eukprot:XP_014155284.1 hypothetical protein SARC_06287 [Sphaeroforma arctica JP610]